jgi:hypothetical protein
VHYTEVTKLNDAYFEARNNIEPKIKNCYVTFRSMESKARALRGYKSTFFQSMFAEYCRGLSRWFKKGKLLG